MKKILLLALACTSATAAAESAFDYSNVDISYERLTIEDDEFNTNLHRHGIYIRGDGELENQVVLKATGSLRGINQNVEIAGDEYEVQQTDLVAGLEVMRYFVAKEGLDFTLGAGIGHIQSETSVKLEQDSTSIDHQFTPVSLNLGSRIYLDTSGRMEIEPFYTLTYVDEDTSSVVGANFFAEVLNDVNLYAGYALHVDDDAHSVTFGVRFD